MLLCIAVFTWSSLREFFEDLGKVFIIIIANKFCDLINF